MNRIFANKGLRPWLKMNEHGPSGGGGGGKGASGKSPSTKGARLKAWRLKKSQGK